jgi:hypothetical protein
MKLLCRDVYNFAGNEIGINSNSTELLGHLRAVYGRFLKETYEPSSIDDKLTKVKSGLEIEIIDNLASANEITINDGFYLNRLSPYNGSYKCVSQNLLNKSQRTGTCDLLHFVQTRNRGIILPAHPDMGKTTMVIKLVMSGCRFLSDEIACFDPDLSRIEAFPRRLSIRNNSRKLLGLPEWSESMDVVKTADNEWMLDIEDIVPDSLSETCTPDFIFFMRGFGDRPRVEHIPESVSLLELLKFTYCAVDDPAVLLFKCAPLINKLRCYNVISGSLDETAELIMEEVDRRSPEDG